MYKRNYDLVLLGFMDRHEASMIIKYIHEGCKGVYAKGPTMAKKFSELDTIGPKWRWVVKTLSRGVTSAKFLVTKSMSLQHH